MNSGTLYEIIWDSIESVGDEITYFEVLGVLELIKAEILEDLRSLADDIGTDNNES